jgi:hypothetical protein
MICEKFLRGMQMTDAITEARAWAQALVVGESRGPGDLANAMRRVSRRTGIDFRILYALRYRPPKDIVVGVYQRLRAAYLAECIRQEKLLAHERRRFEAEIAENPVPPLSLSASGASRASAQRKAGA